LSIKKLKKKKVENGHIDHHSNIIAIATINRGNIY